MSELREAPDTDVAWPPYARFRPWGRRPIHVLLIVFIVQVLFTGMAGHQNDQPDRYKLDVLGYGLLAAGVLFLYFRRKHPVATLAAVMATTSLYYALAYPYGPAFVALVVAIFTAVMRGHLRAAAAVITTGYVVGYLLIGTLIDRDPPTSVQATAIGAWLIVMLVGSELIRGRRERFEETARTFREQRRRKQSEERLRIARELHDVLAHNISLINVQAGVALHLIDEQPEQARPALTAIKQASKEALDELRSVLSVLRGEGDDDSAPRTPAPTLDRAEELIERSAAAGLPVELRIDGIARPLSQGVDLAAYRIVQEALTNVTRHAGLAHAVVTLTYSDDDLRVTVEDDGYGTPSDLTGAGSGIDGMRERAQSLGGTLEAGARPEGGFRVSAVLPT